MMLTLKCRTGVGWPWKWIFSILSADAIFKTQLRFWQLRHPAIGKVNMDWKPIVGKITKRKITTEIYEILDLWGQTKRETIIHSQDLQSFSPFRKWFRCMITYFHMISGVKGSRSNLRTSLLLLFLYLLPAIGSSCKACYINFGFFSLEGVY